MSDNITIHGGGGLGCGTVLAIVISFYINHSILWAIIHGFLGWFYVIYVLLGGGQ